MFMGPHKYIFLGYTLLFLFVSCFNVISTLFLSSISLIESTNFYYYLGYLTGQLIYVIALFILLAVYTYDKKKSYKIGFGVGLSLIVISFLLGNILVVAIWILFLLPYVYSSYKLWKDF